MAGIMLALLLLLQVVRGDIDLDSLEDASLDDDELLKKLITLPGIGPFSAANMLQLLGRYKRIACDSETVRHFRDHHKRTACNSSNVEATAIKVCSPHDTSVQSVYCNLQLVSAKRAIHRYI